MNKSLLLVCLFAFSAAVAAHADDVAYDNSTPLSYSTNGIAINEDYSVTDSFHLSSAATVDAISFGDWLATGASFESVQWEITTALDGGRTLGSGTATAFSSVNEGTVLSSYVINDLTFAVPSLSLAASTTYYFELDHAVTSDGSETFWDYSENPNSTGYLNGGPYSDLPISSETFALLNTESAVTPEPSSLLLFGTGMAGLALFCIVRRRRMPGSAAKFTI